MDNKNTIVITGSARRLGKEIALALAREGYSLVIHSTNETDDSKETLSEIRSLGIEASYISANFDDPEKSAEIFKELFRSVPSIFALINNAAVFEGNSFLKSDFKEWQRIMDINLSVPYLLSLNFARSLKGRPGRIINMLDWRALRPGKDHFAYTISKAALASMTKSMALALAPEITVNGLALGAILPPADEVKSLADPFEDNTHQSKENSILKSIIDPVPAARWADIKEVTDTVSFLLSGPAYITGEIIHIDGGRHLV
jgi:NAD(P)-dependent dehydrogenase (short-subunit alcohol dehydrogenase family)